MSYLTVMYQVEVSRDGSWWLLGKASTADKAHELARSKHGYDTLPRRTLRISTERKVEIVEEGP